MRFNKIQDGINDITTLFYRVGFWHQEPTASPRQLALKLFHCILYFQFSISLIGGAITTDSIGESVFLMQSSIIVTVLLIKLCFLIWKQNEIVEFLNRICKFPIRYDDDCIRVNVKLKKFVTFVRVMVVLSLAAGVAECVIIPIVTTEKYLFYDCISVGLENKRRCILDCSSIFVYRNVTHDCILFMFDNNLVFTNELLLAI